MAEKFDFGGWATKNDLVCADGRIIRRDAFKDNDGQTVPLVYQHNHNDPMGILGHALLENREDGVYAYCSFNNTANGQHVKESVAHGDVVSLSIYANKLVQKGQDVVHGLIREVSVVLAGANPGAYIDNPILVHGEGTADERYEDVLDEAMIYTGEPIELCHSESEKKKEDAEKKAAPSEPQSEGKPEEKSEEKKSDKEDAAMANEKEKTVQDVFNEFTEEQKKVVYFMIGQALEDEKGPDADKDDEDEGDTKMKHNVFDNDQEYGSVLSHSEEVGIIEAARKCGSLRTAMHAFCDEHELQHDDLQPVSGAGSYPVDNVPAAVDALFPEYRPVRPGAPDIVTNDQAWVKAVLGKVGRTPFAKVRTASADLREADALRAKGYKKGRAKTIADNYSIVNRKTNPTTVTYKDALNRDDVLDIEDFSYVDFQYAISRMGLEGEIARAILIGDGRQVNDADKIDEECIRPIWTDHEVYGIRKVVDASAAQNDPGFGDGFLYLDAVEKAILEAMDDYHGSGSVVMFYEQSFFNKLRLARDLNGRKLYQNKAELFAALDVENGFKVPEFKNKTRTVGNKTYRLLAIIGNMGDYNVGAVKDGEITQFKDFDIDFNQYKSLLETRMSGAITRIGSFIILEEEVNPQ